MYHGIQVVDALYRSRVLGDLLIEAIAEVVGGIRGDDECLPVLLGDESGEAAAGCGLANSALAANEYPTKGFLVDDVLKCSCELALHLELC